MQQDVISKPDILVSKSAEVRKIGYLLVPHFSMLSLASVVETLREVNRQAGMPLYELSLISEDGEAVPASCGMPIQVEQGIHDKSDYDMVLVLAGFNPHHARNTVYSWLRRLSRHGTAIAGISTGAHVLASAGLLDGYRATIHWENATSALEEFPDVEWTGNLIEIDRDRYTCSGGAATLDLMLNIINRHHDANLTSNVANQFQHERVRSPLDEQKTLEQQRLRVKSEKLHHVINVMEHNIEETIPLDELASSVGLSRRQLERLFRLYLGCSPGKYYRDVRLNKARSLLIQTNKPIIEVAMATGFVSISHFTQIYRGKFGLTPREARYSAL